MARARDDGLDVTQREQATERRLGELAAYSGSPSPVTTETPAPVTSAFVRTTTTGAVT